MNWFNYFGLIIVIIIMLPNIVFAIKHKEGFENVYKNKIAEICEQIGRYACMCFMILTFHSPI